MAEGDAVSYGIGQGINNFVDTYLKTRQIKRQEAGADANLLSQGLIKNPDTGLISLSPEKQTLNQAAAQKAQTSLDADTPGTASWNSIHKLAKGLLKQAHPTAKDSDLAYIDEVPGSQLTGENGLISKDIAGGYGVQEAKQRGVTTREMFDHKQEATLGKEDRKAFTDLADHINPNKGRAGNLAQLQQKVNQADRLNGLLARGENLTGPETNELAIGIGNLLSNGSQAAQATIHELVPSSAQGNTQDLISWLKNEPRGRQQQAFVQRMSKTLDTEKQISSTQLKNAQYSQIPAYEHLKGKDEARFNGILAGQGLTPEEYEQFKQSRGGGSQGLLYNYHQGQQQPGGPATQTPKTGAPSAPPIGTVHGTYKFLGSNDPNVPANGNDPKQWGPVSAGLLGK